MSSEPYNNEGFGWAFLTIVFFMLVFPAMLLFSSLDTWDIFVQMHLPDGDCWENAKHEKVCKGEVDCKFLSAFIYHFGYYGYHMIFEHNDYDC